MNPFTNGLHFNMDEALYRSDPGFNQSTLKDFGTARSPAHFKDRKPREETDSLRIGNYVDWATFRVHELGQRVAVWPGERKGNEWKAFKEENKEKTILNGSEHERALGAASAIAVHEDTQRILKVSNSQVIGIAQHPRLLLRMKCLIDIVPDAARCDPLLLSYLFDLKTAADASTEGFSRACYEFGYDVQAAFYMDVLNFLGFDVRAFGFIVVENQPPFAVKIHYLQKDSREIRRARQRYEDWMISYSNCLKLNSWPGYTESWSEIQFKPWMLRDENYVGEELQ